MNQRAGTTLVELALVLLLFSVVLGGLAEFIRSQGTLARLQRAESRFGEAVRTARLVVGTELRAVTARDVAALSGDSVRARIFRGSGIACSMADEAVGVRLDGVRHPDPSKDSVLLISAGREESREVVDVQFGACSGDGVLLRLDAPPQAAAAMVLLYEAGSYHLADGALRYRRGGSGRQPLTEAVLGNAAFTSATGRIGMLLGVDEDSLPGLRRGDSTVRVLTHQLNGIQ